MSFGRLEMLRTSLLRLVGFSLLAASVSVNAEDKWFQSNMDCLVEPNKEVELSAAVYGVLSDVNVQRGDAVTQGQIVASLMSGAEKAAVDLAQARVEFSQRKALRNEDLYQDELISNHEKDEIDTEILISKLQLRQAQEQLKLRKVISPINGVVVERDKDPGEYVERESLLTVVSLDPLYVEVVAPSEYISNIKKGMQGDVTLAGAKTGTYKAEVSLVDQVIDAASDTIRVRLLLPNPNNEIPAGLKCSVSFSQPDQKQAMR